MDNSNAPNLTAEQWSARAEPGISGDLIAIDIDAVPELEGQELAFIEADVQGVVTPLELGGAPDATRWVRGAKNAANTVRLRCVWMTGDAPILNHNGNFLAETTTRSAWSDARSVTTETAAQPRIRIEKSRDTGIAPAGMVFAATGLGFDTVRPYHDLRYKWTFDDPGEFTRLGADFPWGRDRNLGYGPQAAHTWETPGTHTVTVTATDGVETATETFEVVVADPAAAFPGVRTICVSGAGDFEGAPDGSIRVSTLAQARGAWGRNADTRVLLRRGETFREALGVFDHNIFHLGAFGTGADPVWRDEDGTGGGILSRNVKKEFAVWGIDFIGPYDAGMPMNTIKPANCLALQGLTAHITIHDLYMSGWNTPISLLDEDTPSVTVSNTYVTNWLGYGHLSGGEPWIGYAGTSMKQNPATYGGDDGEHEGKAPFIPDNTPFRVGGAGHPHVFTMCDMASFTTWSGGRSSYQSCWRWNHAGQPIAPRLNLDRNRAEGGAFSFGTENTRQQNYPSQIVVDKLHHIPASIFQANVMGDRRGGVTMRNFVTVIPDADPMPQYDPDKNVIYGLKNVFGTNLDDLNDPDRDPVEIYSFDIIDQRRSAYFGTRNGRYPFQPFVAHWGPSPDYANYVLYAPNADNPPADQTPLDFTSHWAPLHRGRHFPDENGGEPWPGSETKPEAAVLPVPLPGSPAIGDADTSKPVALDDFFGNLRGADPSRGAFEPT